MCRVQFYQSNSSKISIILPFSYAFNNLEYSNNELRNKTLLIKITMK